MSPAKKIKSESEVAAELSEDLERALLAADVALSGLRDAAAAIAQAASSIEAVREICRAGQGVSTKGGPWVPKQGDLLSAIPVPRAD